MAYTYIPVQVPDSDVEEIENLVKENRFLNRSDAIRNLIKRGLTALKQEIQLGDKRPAAEEGVIA